MAENALVCHLNTTKPAWKCSIWGFALVWQWLGKIDYLYQKIGFSIIIIFFDI